MKKLEKEIFELLSEIHNDPANKDQYGQVGVYNLREDRLKSSLSKQAYDFLCKGKSRYGSFCTYGGRFGSYRALTLDQNFYKEQT